MGKRLIDYPQLTGYLNRLDMPTSGLAKYMGSESTVKRRRRNIKELSISEIEAIGKCAVANGLATKEQFIEEIFRDVLATYFRSDSPMTRKQETKLDDVKKLMRCMVAFGLMNYEEEEETA